jgi:hypothetical protein
MPSVSVAGPGEHCGGNIATALVCDVNYHCAPEPGSTLPFGDVGGICIADVIYRMEIYGLMVKLPDDWSGFSVRTETWEGVDVATGNVVKAGPKIVLRHPAWTQAKPYEDLPILILSPAQWRLVSTEQLSLGAAPIGPSMLASNSEYVFALPARYNYDFSQGFEELDAAIRSGAVTAVEPIHY